MNPDALFHALDRAGPVARVLLPALRHRGELVALEVGEARDHAFTSLTLALGATALALLGGFAATLAFAAFVWPREDRVLLLGLLALACLLGSGGLAWFTTRRLRRWRPLAETRAQLDADQDCIGRLLSPPKNSPHHSSP